MNKKDIIIQLAQGDRLVSVSENQSIMEAALSSGIKLIHSCRQGQCGSCRAFLVDGEVDMRNNGSLFEDEVKQGQVLLCQSFPITETVTVKPIRQKK